MAYDITSEDYRLSLQRTMLLKLRLQIYSLKDDEYITEISGTLISGSGSISGDSDIRRTYTMEMIPDRKSAVYIGENGYIWLNTKVKVFLGITNECYDAQLAQYQKKIKSYRETVDRLNAGTVSNYELKVIERLGVDTSDYTTAANQLQKIINAEEYPTDIKWYAQGVYLFTASSATYDSVTNTMSISCSDLMSWLDGTRNGTLGQLTIDCPAYKTLLSTSLVTAAGTAGVDTTNYNAIFNWCVSQKEYNYYATEITSKSATVKNAIFQLITGSLSAAQENSYFEIVKAEYPHVQYTVDAGVRQLNSHYTYRDYIIQIIGQLGRFTDYNIDEIGELGAFKDYNKDWQTYRATYPEWQYLPEDLTFSAGSTVLGMVNEIMNYVKGFEKYMDENGVFCANQIPTCYSDTPVLLDDYMQSILISESNSVQLTEVKNIANLWGQVIDPDFYAQSGVSLSGSTYVMSIGGYDDTYCNGDMVAISIPAANPNAPYININSFGAIPIYDGNTEQPLAAGVLSANETYCFKIYKKRDTKNGTDVVKAYFQGQWQVHTMAVLVSSANGDPEHKYTTTSGTTVNRYSLQYFQDVYGCKDVYLEVQPDSPYTVQKIGEITASYSGGDYDKLTDVTKALAEARYLLWTTSRLTDSISIVTRLTPFMDVNQKIEFVSHCYDFNKVHQYIVKSLAHDMNAGTTSWTLQRFYPQYQPGLYNSNDSDYDFND